MNHNNGAWGKAAETMWALFKSLPLKAPLCCFVAFHKHLHHGDKSRTSAHLFLGMLVTPAPKMQRHRVCKQQHRSPCGYACRW